MGKRKPNAADRDLADYVRNLPVGKHMIEVEVERAQACLKSEGGLIMMSGDNRISIPRFAGERPVKVSMQLGGKGGE